MNLSDSDSDDFFGDIRALRRKFGLSKANKSPAKATNQTPSLNKQSGKRLAKTPLHSTTSKFNKKQSIEDNKINSSTDSDNAPAATLGIVSAGEIAALLSPRGTTRQRRKKKPVSSGMTSNANSAERTTRYLSESSPSIPVRTPESRIADPHLLLTRSKTSPATPTAAPRGSSSKRTKTTIGSGRSPDMMKFDLRSLWEKADASPLATPIGRNRLLSSLKPSPGVQIRDTTPRNSAYSIANTFADSALDQGGLLGKVEEELLTKEDIEAAQRKLSQEQTLTQQQVIRDIRERITGFTNSSYSVSAAMERLQCSVTLLCQFYTFGHGELAYDEQGIGWHGEFIGPIANVAQSLDSAGQGVDNRLIANTTLLFPWLRISSVRLKSIDDKDYIMATIDSDLGIAFELGSTDASSTQIVQRMNQQHSKILAEHQLQQPKGSTVFESSGSSQETQELVSLLLSYAKTHDTEFEDLDIEQAMANSEFMQLALPSITSLCRQLASDAQAVFAYTPNNAKARNESTAELKLCTLCYAEDEAIKLEPCCHQLCEECFSHLQRIYPSSSQAEENDPSVICTCPWDRCGISVWSKL
ncbi:hypothetical protein IWW36_000668 [Coemansia brasiliensis]|uniref:RING-type domain-containing protein n=1 Tax=Coemansia brasiliensis TaxID=2650707 RepID=A0A9W8IAR8_9FUNG|nr:hypothetical protein IWW36_000668 [Coemansia brasiliensis]